MNPFRCKMAVILGTGLAWCSWGSLAAAAAESQVLGGGRLEPIEDVTVRNEAGQDATVLWIVSDGAPVRKGDLLIELDAAELREELEVQQAEVGKEEAALAGAASDLKHVSHSGIRLREMALESAKRALEKADAEFRLQLKIAETELDLAEQRVGLAQERQERSRRQFENGRLGSDELEAVQLAAVEAGAALTIARAKQEFLAKVAGPYQQDAAALAVARAEAELEEARFEWEREIKAAEADVRALESTLAMQRAKLGRLEERVSRCKIHSPVDGIAMHIAPPRAMIGSEPEPIEAGLRVRSGQRLLQVIDPRKLEVALWLGQPGATVRVGDSVQVRVDAFPDRVFRGEISQVIAPANVPGLPGSAAKPSRARVAIQDPSPDLRPGMTATVQIERR